MNDEYELDFDELRKIYRLEVKSPKLSKLNADFYKALKKYIKLEKKKYLNALESFSQIDLKKFENLKKMVQKIREIRLKKCLNLCLIYSRTNDFAEDNLIDFEVDFVKDVLKLMDKQNQYTNSLFGLKKKKKELLQDYVKVKVLQDIPSFIGTDMKEYGPFEKGEVCEVPKNVYDILYSKKIVEKV
jgi:DNA replication initiation complex subunit (GINS family)